MSKVRGLSIEPRSCIDLIMHANVVKRLIKLHNHSIMCTKLELTIARFPKLTFKKWVELEAINNKWVG